MTITGTRNENQNEKVLVAELDGGNTTDGLKLGPAATSKIGFWGAAVLSQRAGAVQVTISPVWTQTSPFGFSTSALANDFRNILNEVVTTLTLYGMWKGSA